MTSINWRRLWVLFAVGLILHGVIDPIVTYLIVIQTQTGYEANPFLYTMLIQGPLYFAVSHLLLYVIAIGCFAGVMWLLRISSGRARRQVHTLTNVVLIGIILWGVFLVGWNLSIFLSG